MAIVGDQGHNDMSTGTRISNLATGLSCKIFFGSWFQGHCFQDCDIPTNVKGTGM